MKPKILAVMSMPRLAFTDNMRCVSMLAEMGIPVIYSTGAYWAKGINNCFQVAINNGYDYVLTIDYDAVFTKDDIKLLYQEAESLCLSVVVGDMSGRESIGSLYTTTHPDKVGELLPVDTAHFGLSLFPIGCLKGIDQDWIRGGKGIDPDIMFWYELSDLGYQAYVHKGVKVGHLELRIKWPDGGYQGVDDYYERGRQINSI